MPDRALTRERVLIPPALTRRTDFPLLQHQPQLVFLDSAASTHKPRVVIDAERQFYTTAYGPVHRSLYDLGATASEQFEATRAAVAQFIGADAPEIIFTHNATEALNLVAWIEAARLKAGDEIMLSVAEHHSNLLPWQRLACQKALQLVWIEVTPDQQFDYEDFTKKLSARTKLVAVTQVSNVLGFVSPLSRIIPAAHRVGARVVVDAAQSAARLPIDVGALKADYLVATGHKMYAPTGTGFLYARQELLAQAQPMIVGGGIVQRVTRQSALWHDGPARFEAGTPHSAGIVGLEAALRYLTALGMEKVWRHEQALVQYAFTALARQPGVTLYGPPLGADRAGIFSFQVTAGGASLHSHDVVAWANEFQVALRGGHHCAQPLLATLGVPELVRASTGIYTTTEDIDALLRAIEAVQARFGKFQKNKATKATS
ncbi:MAG: cysteine desulfurase [Candidatus Andersenbacteria bacterium]